MNIFRKTETPLTQEEITEWLRSLRGNPYVRASGFDVTGVFRAKLGNDENYYFAGVNVENPDHQLSTHAEAGSIAALATALGKKAEIVEGWVMGAPANLAVGDTHALADNKVSCCGKCRQQISGFAEPSVVIHSLSLNGAHEEKTIGELLPNAFSFKQFAPELLQSAAEKDNIKSPAAEEVENRLIRTGKELSQEEVHTWLHELESVDYASKTSQAVIIRLANGAYVAGVKVEDAAFVSIDPVQSALAVANAEFGKQVVIEAWSFGKGRDEAILAEDAYMPLNLSGVQALAQFAAYNAIPIHLMNAKGEQKDIKLSDSARYTPTFDQPVMGIGAGRFIK